MQILSGLTLSAGTLAPTFARDSLSYTATVANRVTSLVVTPTSNHNGAAITVNGASVLRDTISSAISLNVGENTIAIVVTAEDGTTTKTYTVIVTRGVNISDANLRNAIGKALLIHPRHRGNPISPSEMATVTYVDLKGSDVSTFVGLEYATNLDSLNLADASLSDISALSGLTNLYRLYLEDNSISDIPPSLSGLTSLATLFLDENHISDISALLGLTNLGFLELHDNRLSYPSLTIHIPALQARGVSWLAYSPRYLTRLVRISGDAQTGTAGSRLSDPLIVEVQDQNDDAFAGVPVAFSIAAGGGVLSTTTTTTDANGRASTTLTLGVAGANKHVHADRNR